MFPLENKLCGFFLLIYKLKILSFIRVFKLEMFTKTHTKQNFNYLKFTSYYELGNYQFTYKQRNLAFTFSTAIPITQNLSKWF